MAEAETEKKTEKDEVTSDTLVWDPNALKADGTKVDYVQKTISPELYRQQKAAQRKQAGIAAAAGLGAEAIQFGIGATIFGDPAIKAQGARKAQLAAQRRKDPDYLTEAEKQARRETGLAPVQRKAEAVQKRAEKVAASTGDVSVRSLLASGEAGIAQIRQQALDVEADIAKEDLTRQELKRQQDEKARQEEDSIDAMILELKNKYIREPLHKFVASAGKAAGLMMAHAPARSIDDQIAELKKQKVSEEEIAKFIRLARRAGPRRVEKLFNKALGTLPAAVEADNKKLEMDRPMEIAEEALEASGREKRGEATGERGVAEGKSIDEMTEEELKAAATSGPESEFDRKKAADDLQMRRQARLAPYSKANFNPLDRSTGGDFAWNKGSETYVLDSENETWHVYKDGKKLDFEVTIDEAEASDDPNVKELYDLALKEGLLIDRDLREGMRPGGWLERWTQQKANIESGKPGLEGQQKVEDIISEDPKAEWDKAERERILAKYVDQSDRRHHLPAEYAEMPVFRSENSLYIYDDSQKMWLKTDLTGRIAGKLPIKRISRAPTTTPFGEVYNLGVAAGLYE